MTQAISTVMPFTGDFTTLDMNNPNSWTSSSGGIGTKRKEEFEAEATESKDDRYPLPVSNEGLSRAVNMGDFNQSYGSTILTNIARGSDNANPNMVNRDLSPSQQAINVSMNLDDRPTTPAVLPADLTTVDRLNMGSEAYDVGALSNPNTLGDTLSGLVEKVHDNAVSYESQSDMLINKNKGTAFDQAKDSLVSDYSSLSGGIQKQEKQQSQIERQIESYVQVMNSSYEYYIYSSLFVDTGKSISQTAQSLTKG